MFLRVEYVRGGTYSFFLVNKMTNIPVRVLVGVLKQEEDVKNPVASVCMITNKACILYKPEVLSKYLIPPIEDWLKKKPVWCDYDEYIIRNT
jgi:hypothetical protein